MDSTEFLLAGAAVTAVISLLLFGVLSVGEKASAATNHSLYAVKVSTGCFAASMLSSSGEATAVGVEIPENCSVSRLGTVIADGELG